MASSLPNSQETIDKYTCAVCKSIFLEPYSPSGCRHIFCKTCLLNSSVSAASPLCPICRCPFTRADMVFQHKARNEINSLKIECPNCDEPMKLNKYNDHSAICDGASVSPKPFASSQSSNMSSLNSSISSRASMHSSQVPTRQPNRMTFKCPYCAQANLTLEDLRKHCNQLHANDEKNKVCPVCTAMPWGDPNLRSIDFIGHLNLRHKFDYANYVDFNIDEESMLQKAINESLAKQRKGVPAF